MSTPADRVRDGMRLTLDAHVDGQLEALERIQTALRKREQVASETVEADGNATERMKARGAVEEIEQLLVLVDEQIASARAARND